MFSLIKRTLLCTLGTSNKGLQNENNYRYKSASKFIQAS